MSGFKIVVLDRGWVFVGDVSVSVNADTMAIANASCIRCWGTNRGLGQLAADGPQPGTELDPSGTVRAPMRAVILTLDTEPSLWSR